MGLGVWGNFHCEVYSAHPKAELVAICDRDEERVRDFSKRYNVKETYTSSDEMIAKTDIDAVAVVTPDFAHREIAVAAAKAGKHIIVEKPLATSVEDAEAICKAAEENGVRVMVDFHNRWNPLFFKIYESLREGKLGEPAHLYIRHSNTLYIPREMLSWSSKSAVAWFLGAHSADLARWLVGSEVERVTCLARKKHLVKMGIDTQDFFVTTLEFSCGAIAVLENSWLLPESLPVMGDFKAEIVGSKGVAYADFSTHRGVQIFHEKEVLPDILAAPVVQGQAGGFVRESIRHFIDALDEGRAPIVGKEDGLANTKIICAMYQSIAEGNPVSL